MKLYLCPPSITFHALLPALCRRLSFLSILIVFSLISNAQELEFRNASLIAGTDGQDGAVYRFPQVNSKHDVDALVRISGRSSALVQLTSIDITNMGHDKAFQPRVNYNSNNTPSGTSDWWMEFEISFVKSGTSNSVTVDSFDVTGLDVDGNADMINEWVNFYNCKTYSFENNTLLQVSNITELLNSVLTVVGKKFDGPVTNFVDIDTSATTVMTTNHYEKANAFRLRTGGHSTGQSTGSNRLYSFWFRSFSYQAPVEFRLPLVLLSFDAVMNDNKVGISWTTGMEKALSHFVVQRSTNGLDYSDAGIVFANGNTGVRSSYSFSEPVNTSARGVIYYRLRMVDEDGKSQYSQVRLIRLGGVKETMQVITYPNPVKNELRVTIPQGWQNKQVIYEIYNAAGIRVKRLVNNRAGQTETLNVQDIMAAVYFVKVTAGEETAIQRIVKS